MKIHEITFKIPENVDPYDLFLNIPSKKISDGPDLDLPAGLLAAAFIKKNNNQAGW